MSRLLALTGARGSGKDTAFSFIHEWGLERGVSVGRRGFADPLKFSFARLFLPDCTLEEAVQWCDEIKMAESLSAISAEWYRGDAHAGETETKITHSITGRTALQRYGTESHRDVFDNNFWVDALLPDAIDPATGEHVWPQRFRMSLVPDPPEICVVTDCRFPNEAERVRWLGGKIWRIVRYPHEDLGDGHRSEQGLDPDLFIDRDIENVTDDRQAMRTEIYGVMDRLMENA